MNATEMLVMKPLGRDMTCIISRLTSPFRDKIRKRTSEPHNSLTKQFVAYCNRKLMAPLNRDRYSTTSEKRLLNKER